MKALWSLLSLSHARSSDTLLAARANFPGSHVCGMIRGSQGSINDTVKLDEDQSCIYRIKPQKGDGTVRINLEEASNFECEEMQLFIVTDEDVFGPYCKEKRKRRGAYGYDYGKDFAGNNHEIDMVYTNNGGIKFSFNFWFDFELLPGLPGQVQEGFKEHVESYNINKPDSNPYKPGFTTKKPKTTKGYKTTKATTTKYTTTTTNTPTSKYTTTKRTTTSKYSTTSATTTKRTTTTKSTTTTEATTEEYTTFVPTTYEATTEGGYTTDMGTTSTEWFTTEYNPGAGYGPTKKPSYPTYAPNDANCPWESGNGNGDCPGLSGKCNLKYFRICGESFFNRVYDDVCRWQDAKQLIPMFTAKLVPLGGAFEQAMGLQCSGYGQKSIQYLLGDVEINDVERDVPKCSPSAGAPPCHLLDFSRVTTARQFHVKMEELFESFLKHKCNDEWGVHFRALLVRMRHSLFCDDGSKPDHAGYVVSSPPPKTTANPYNPANPNNTPKPYLPNNSKPYKPKPPKNPYKPNPTPKPYNPPSPSNTPKPYNPPTPPTTQKTPKPYKPSKPANPYKPKPTYKPPGTCPWEGGNSNGDCPGSNGKCNLKYFRVCGESFFNRVYNDICRWQDAKQLIPMITAKLVPLGGAFENANGKCNGYGGRSMQDLLGDDARRLTSERDIPLCKPSAGAPPCHFLDFSDVTTARQFHTKMEELYHNFLSKHCNGEWGVHFKALLVRMRHSLFCDDGSQSDHEGYVISTPPPKTTNSPYKPPQTTTKSTYRNNR